MPDTRLKEITLKCAELNKFTSKSHYRLNPLELTYLEDVTFLLEQLREIHKKFLDAAVGLRELLRRLDE